MKLYLNLVSPNVRRVRLTAALLALELEEISLDLRSGEHKKPWYLAINPNGQVPTLVDGDFVLTESRAIMQYLASKKPESGLLPRDEQARAEVTRWQFWDATQFSPNLGTLAFQRVVKPQLGLGEPDASKIDEALAGFRRLAAVLNQQLDGKRYLLGASMTLADVTLASSLTYAKQSDVPVAEFANVQAWLAHMSEMDAWKRTCP